MMPLYRKHACDRKADETLINVLDRILEHVETLRKRVVALEIKVHDLPEGYSMNHPDQTIK